MLNPDTAFKLSAATGDIETCESQLKRFLRHTPLKAIQLINMRRNRISFKTISK